MLPSLPAVVAPRCGHLHEQSSLTCPIISSLGRSFAILLAACGEGDLGGHGSPARMRLYRIGENLFCKIDFLSAGTYFSTIPTGVTEGSRLRK
eukprot:6090932-Pleurochrysis_carterae.AAC.1